MNPSEIEALQRLRTDLPYFLETCCKIRDKAGNLIPAKINRAQSMVWDVEREQLRTTGNARVFILKARQGGITTAEQLKNLWTIWSSPGTSVMTLAHSRDDTNKIFRISKRAVDHFPDGLLPKLGTSQAQEISFPNLDSAFWTGTAGAKRTGRGVTLTRVHGSEFAFWDEPLVALNAIVPALRPTGSTVVLETTAAQHGSDAYDFWMGAQNGVNGYRAVFLPWWVCDYEMYRMPLEEDDELGKLADDEAMLVKKHGIDFEQLKWRRQMMLQMGRSRFLQEYAESPETCWLVSGDMFFDAVQLKELMDAVVEPVREEDVEDDGYFGKVHVYNDPGQERIIIGVDVAEGGGKDRSAYVARAFPSWKLIETFADNKITPKAFAGVLVKRARKLNRAFVTVEKNGHGITVLREMRDVHKYPTSRMYHRAVYDQATRKKTLKIGWTTRKETVPLMLDAARELFTSSLARRSGTPPVEVVRDAYNVVRDNLGQVSLNGKDMLVGEMLAWLSRDVAGGSYKSFTTGI